MLAFLEGPDLLVVALIVLLVFGGSRLPQLARSLGQAQREFHKGLQDEPAATHDPEPKAAAHPPDRGSERDQPLT